MKVISWARKNARFPRARRRALSVSRDDVVGCLGYVVRGIGGRGARVRVRARDGGTLVVVSQVSTARGVDKERSRLPVISCSCSCDPRQVRKRKVNAGIEVKERNVNKKKV